MKNLEVARLFDLMADLLEIKDENPFARLRAMPTARYCVRCQKSRDGQERR